MIHLPFPMRNSYLAILCCLIYSYGYSQEQKATVGNIEVNGLHKILLAPELRSASKENTSFLRLLDENNNEVPYVILQGFDHKFSDYTDLGINSIEVLKDSVTSILIENTTNTTLEQITLKIANTAVNKIYSVSGSDDQLKWFGLVSDGRLYNLNSDQKTFTEKTISFPLNTYAYLKIDVDDRNSLPINVLAAGLYKGKIKTQPPMILDNFTYNIQQDKEKKTTSIAFFSQLPHQIDAMVFEINTPQYIREAKIVTEKPKDPKKRNALNSDIVSHFQLNSETDEMLGFNPFTSNKFIIEIENKDNPPLDVKSIKLTQNPLYMLAELKVEGTYEIVIDSTYTKPSYDLVNFISDIKADVPEAKISSLVQLDSKNRQSEKSFWQTNLFMWSCIALGIFAVGYFAVGLLKDMKT